MLYRDVERLHVYMSIFLKGKGKGKEEKNGRTTKHKFKEEKTNEKNQKRTP